MVGRSVDRSPPRFLLLLRFLVRRRVSPLFLAGNSKRPSTPFSCLTPSHQSCTRPGGENRRPLSDREADRSASISAKPVDRGTHSKLQIVERIEHVGGEDGVCRVTLSEKCGIWGTSVGFSTFVGKSVNSLMSLYREVKKGW